MLNPDLNPKTYPSIQRVQKTILNPRPTVLRKGERIARFGATKRNPRYDAWTQWAGSEWWVRWTELLRIWNAYVAFFPSLTSELRPISWVAGQLLQIPKSSNNDAEVIVEATIREDIMVFFGVGVLEGVPAPSELRSRNKSVPLGRPVEQLYIPEIVDSSFRLSEIGRKAFRNVGFRFLSTGPI